ncbi:MAG: hypothetical protein JXR44_03340 [Thiotrichales bacterium]|nr:hypothetical protein [Thiotrichales bacterium]
MFTFKKALIAGSLLSAALLLSACDKYPETGKVIAYPSEVFSGHVYFMKADFAEDWAQEIRPYIEKERTASSWSLTAEMELPKNLKGLLSKEQQAEYLQQVDLFKERLLNNAAFEVEQTGYKLDLFEKDQAVFEAIIGEPRRKFLDLETQKRALEERFKEIQAQLRTDLGHFIKQNQLPNQPIKEDEQIVQAQRSSIEKKSAEQCHTKYPDSSIYLFHPAQNGLPETCYKLYISGLSKLRKHADAEKTQQLEAKLTPILANYVEILGQYGWSRTDALRAEPSISKQFAQAEKEYRTLLRTASQKMQLVAPKVLNDPQARDAYKKNLEQQNELAQIQLSMVKEGGFPTSGGDQKFINAKKQVTKSIKDRISQELKEKAETYFLGSVPIENDGHFRVLPKADSAILAVTIQPTGFASLVDNRLAVFSMTQSLHSETVKETGIFEFDYSQTRRDPTVIRLAKTADEKALKIALLTKLADEEIQINNQ